MFAILPLKLISHSGLQPRLRISRVVSSFTISPEIACACVFMFSILKTNNKDTSHVEGGTRVVKQIP